MNKTNILKDENFEINNNNNQSDKFVDHEYIHKKFRKRKLDCLDNITDNNDNKKNMIDLNISILTNQSDPDITTTSFKYDDILHHISSSTPAAAAIHISKKPRIDLLSPLSSISVASQSQTSSSSSSSSSSLISPSSLASFGSPSISMLSPSPTPSFASKKSSSSSTSSSSKVTKKKYDKQLTNIYQYHTNMIRSHPEKERTNEEQIKRDKNTIACWISRRKKKLTDLMIAEQYDVNLKKYDRVIEETIRSSHYIDHLLKIIVKNQGKF